MPDNPHLGLEPVGFLDNDLGKYVPLMESNEVAAGEVRRLLGVVVPEYGGGAVTRWQGDSMLRSSGHGKWQIADYCPKSGAEWDGQSRNGACFFGD